MDLRKRNFSEKEIIIKANAIRRKLQDFVPSKAVESDTVDLLTKLVEKNIKTMGLTARIPKSIGFTAKQINEIGIIFNPVSPNINEILFDQSTLYSNGILYVGLFGNKGKALLHFFKKINHTPKKVVFVDDKLN